MITITVEPSKVTISNEAKVSTEFVFNSTVRMQHFLDGLRALVPFIGEFRIVDDRR